MKRLFSLIMALAMSISLFTVSASAAANATAHFALTAGGKSDIVVQTGDVITVTYALSADKSVDISTNQNEIKYNKDFFELVSGSNQTTVSGYVTSTPMTGYVYFNTAMNSKPFGTTPTAIGTFQLKVIAASGESTISNTRCKAFDSGTNELAVSTSDLHVSIGAPQPQTYQVKFLGENGATYQTLTPNAGDPITLPAGPEKDKHSFSHWSLSGDTTRYLPGNSFTPTSDTEFHPNWTADPIVRYTLTWQSNGGTPYAAQAYDEGTTVVLDKVPTRGGYTFDGWYLDSALTNPATSVVMNSDITVYAKWSKNPAQTPSGNTPPSGEPSDDGCDGGPDCPLDKFTDLPEDWYHDGIHYCVENGLMNGNTATTFNPNGITTRGQIVAILYRLEGSPTVSSENPFSDLKPGAYYEKAVIWAATSGIVTGYDDGTFRPNNQITRQQLAAILYRYASYKSYRIENLTDITAYADSSSVSSYAVEPMKWAVGNGLITGYSNNTLSPGGNAKRSHVAVILMRFCQNIAE